MTLDEILSEIKLELTGMVLDSELEDAQLTMVVNTSLRELERYWDETTRITVPYASCIDLTNFDHCSIVKVYRVDGYGGASDSVNAMTDPVWAQQWMVFSNLGTMYNLQDYVLNFAAWNTMTQIRNTISTDLSYVEDRHNNKLYINSSSATGQVTIEYIPKINTVEDIKSTHWIDILVRLSVAKTKVILGRIRTKYKQSGGLWELDGDKILEEGNAELKELRDEMKISGNLCAPID